MPRAPLRSYMFGPIAAFIDAMTNNITDDDLRARGVRFASTADPAHDPDWKAVLQKTYPPGFVV